MRTAACVMMIGCLFLPGPVCAQPETPTETPTETASPTITPAETPTETASPTITPAVTATPTASPPPTAAPTATGVPKGGDGIMLGAFIPPPLHADRDEYREAILDFDRAAGKRHTHVMYYAEFNYDIDAYPDLIGQIRAAGKTPIICWQSGREGAPDPAFSNSSFIRGDHDSSIRKMARKCKAFGDTIYMRWAHEMNIPSSPAWPGHDFNRRAPGEFIAMWRRVHQIFTDEGADNVKWIWSINYLSSPEPFSSYNALYPGDDVVDMIGVSGLNYGDHPTAGPGFSVTAQWLYVPVMRDMMAGTYAAPAAHGSLVRGLARLGRGKPLGSFSIGAVGLPSETTVPGSTTSTIPKAEWIRHGYDALAHMEEFRTLRLVLWYNGVAASGGVQSDFRVLANRNKPGDSEYGVPSTITQAYRDAVRDPRYVTEELDLSLIAPDGFYSAESSLPPAEYPQHELLLNVRPGGVIRQGETLSAAFFLHPAEEPMTGRRWVDAYVVAQIPGGGWYAYAPPRAWAPFGLGRGAPPPPAAVYGLDVHREIQGMAFTMEMERDLPTGEYAVYSILAPRGSDPRWGGPDLRVAMFTLGEAP